MNAGGSCDPPIDVLYCSAYGLLKQLFLGVCLGLMFERRIRMLHVGPPCSGCSVARNGIASKRMRSEQYPAGLPFLSDVRRETVTLGDALAEFPIKLCQAVSLVGCVWTWETQWISLMWIYQQVKALMWKCCKRRHTLLCAHLVRHGRSQLVQRQGFDQALELVRHCMSTKPHQMLRGSGPDGRAWAATASPYWQAFAEQLALTCCVCEPCADKCIIKSR